MARKSFTIMEVLVMVTVFIFIAASAVANFTVGRGTARLRAVTQELAANIQKAQTLAYANVSMKVCGTDTKICGSGSACDPTMPTGCTTTPILTYGVTLDVNSDGKRYIIFADANSSGTYNAGEAIPYGVFNLPTDVTIQSVTPAANKTLIYSYNSANFAPFVNCSSNCTTTIALYDAKTSKTRTVAVSAQTGSVSVY
jgi:type II secretory pathway pseudopilin PulG